MQKPKRLKVTTPGPRLWLQRQYSTRWPQNRSRTGLAVIPEEQRDEEQHEVENRQQAASTSPGWAREARLRAQYAAEYPGITPAVWMPVAELSAKLIERVHAARREGRHTRTFDPTHFEFRGGSSGPRPRAARTRSTDPKL
jgi:hypothetical protein